MTRKISIKKGETQSILWTGSNNKLSGLYDLFKSQIPGIFDSLSNVLSVWSNVKQDYIAYPPDDADVNTYDPFLISPLESGEVEIDEIITGTSRTVYLLSGWNLVGWTGEDTTAKDIYDLLIEEGIEKDGLQLSSSIDTDIEYPPTNFDVKKYDPLWITVTKDGYFDMPISEQQVSEPKDYTMYYIIGAIIIVIILFFILRRE